MGWGGDWIGYLRPVQFLDHLTVIITTELPLFCKKFELRETFFEFMCEEGDKSASFEIQSIRLDIFSVGGFERKIVSK